MKTNQETYQEIKAAFGSPIIQYVVIPLTLLYTGHTLYGVSGVLLAILLLTVWRVWVNRDFFRVLWLGLLARQALKKALKNNKYSDDASDTIETSNDERGDK